MTRPVRAAAALSLTGRFARQGNDAADGVRLWAEDAGVQLTVLDDGGSKDVAVNAYEEWARDVDVLLGPYASGLVRAVVPVLQGAGRSLWNHGGSADDLAQPGVISLPAPASSYFHGAVDEAAVREVSRVVVARGAGPFARTVAHGALRRAAARGLDAEETGLAALAGADLEGVALLVVGRFGEDVEAVRAVHGRGRSPALLGAVAAGIQAFGEELGEAAEGVLGPVQWRRSGREPQVGPTGDEFAERYLRRTGRAASYVAAQAAAAGYLAHASLARGLGAEGVREWVTSTLLGDFALDSAWRQVGHRVSTIRWHHGRMVRIGAEPGPRDLPHRVGS